ncbi:hypothetical protein VI01_04595 [Pantoea sp. SM3]|nr:hypothetical protein VI01_04595 [Pantoea sp. SM3]
MQPASKATECVAAQYIAHLPSIEGRWMCSDAIYCAPCINNAAPGECDKPRRSGVEQGVVQAYSWQVVPHFLLAFGNLRAIYI